MSYDLDLFASSGTSWLARALIVDFHRRFGRTVPLTGAFAAAISGRSYPDPIDLSEDKETYREDCKKSFAFGRDSGRDDHRWWWGHRGRRHSRRAGVGFVWAGR